MEMETLRWLTEESTRLRHDLASACLLSCILYTVQMYDAHLCWLQICTGTEMISTGQT